MILQMNKDKIIKLLGALLITTGSLQLIFSAEGIWLTLAGLFRPSSFWSFQAYLYYSAASLFFFIILPSAIFMAGIGLFKFRQWGWQLAVTVCTITLIVKLIGTINFAYAAYKTWDLPMPKMPEGAHVGIVSMWPTYIYGIISALLILLLTRNSIKSAFNPSLNQTQLEA